MRKLKRKSFFLLAFWIIFFIGILLWLSSRSWHLRSGMQYFSRMKLDHIRAVLLPAAKRPARNPKQAKDRQDEISHLLPTVSCKEPVGNVVLIKTHKTGSTTLAHIVNSFGYVRNLSFLLPKDVRFGRSFIWEVDPSNRGPTGFLPPLRSSKPSVRPTYNIFSLHTTFNHQVLESVVAPGAKFVTSVRDPVRQFESAFVFFKFHLALPERFQDEGVDMDAKIEEWLRSPGYYRKRYETVIKQGLVKTPNAELYCHNSQMRDLGFDMKHQENDAAILEYISVLDRQFDVVVVTEYFDESLLVLRKELCWSVDDILYIPQNERPEEMKTAMLSENLQLSVRGWNAADQLLFEHFNKSLWRKIADYGDDFRSDLEAFRDRLSETFQSCIEEKEDKLEFSRVKYIRKKKGPQACKILASTKNQLMEKIRQRQVLM